MKVWVAVCMLISISAVHQASAQAACDLTGAENVPFPDIETEGAESYMMNVEYSLPNAKQTSYFVEYYDIFERQGRVDSHQNGKSATYIYRTATKEAWEISSTDCKFREITDTPAMYKDDQTEWSYFPSGKDERVTIGPSAMFKNAFDIFNGTGKAGYMGQANEKIRGLDAKFWRRCTNDGKAYVEYYFASEASESPYDISLTKTFPIRVFFNGTRDGEDKDLNEQQYDIINFKPFISPGLKPFELPKGKGCKRKDGIDQPEIPNFLDKNLQFYAEAIYRKVDRSGEATEYWSYYNTLMLALDQKSQHLAYYFTPWSSKKSKDNPESDAPEYIIYDMKHGYTYLTNMADASCSIARDSKFAPKYKLPEDAGEVLLTDPSILFPNNEPVFISEGTNRGLKVNIYEGIVENYVLDSKDGPITIPKAIITHSYLQDNEIEENTASVKNALAQVQLRLIGREKDVIELLTFNFFGFSTEIYNRRSVFNIQRCFKNDDDYVWVTLGFDADKTVLANIREDSPAIQSNILNDLQLKSELNAVRIPVIMVDVTDALYVTMLVLDKPFIMLDYLEPEDGKTISGAEDVEGISDLYTCANNCLEVEDNCWGFSMCGAKCSYGSATSSKTEAKTGCKVYNRFNKDAFIPSKELMVENLRREVETGDVKLLLLGKDGNRVQVDASSIDVTDPGEDDRFFERIGNLLNPRMKVKKAGFKLKSGVGSAIKNMGKLRYDECQRVCLDFKDCETVSYCLTNQECVISAKYGDEIKDAETEEDNMCNLVTRKYADHFDRSPGNVLSITAQEIVDLGSVDDCARACLKQSKFNCLSFDHCPAAEKGQCKMHTVYYPNPSTREAVQKKDTNCGHYFRKFSTEFKKTYQKKTIGAKLPPLTNMTLEECSKTCMEYGKGTCYGFDFCQDSTMLATSCTLLDTDPSQLKTAYSPICTNYLRTEPQFAPRPYTTGYAGGIGFLCFVIGAIVGCVIVFGIAYLKVNRR